TSRPYREAPERRGRRSAREGAATCVRLLIDLTPCGSPRYPVTSMIATISARRRIVLHQARPYERFLGVWLWLADLAPGLCACGDAPRPAARLSPFALRAVARPSRHARAARPRAWSRP